MDKIQKIQIKNLGGLWISMYASIEESSELLGLKKIPSNRAEYENYFDTLMKFLAKSIVSELILTFNPVASEVSVSGYDFRLNKRDIFPKSNRKNVKLRTMYYCNDNYSLLTLRHNFMLATLNQADTYYICAVPYISSFIIYLTVFKQCLLKSIDDGLLISPPSEDCVMPYPWLSYKDYENKDEKFEYHPWVVDAVDRMAYHA